jgi:hypothetical protein
VSLCRERFPDRPQAETETEQRRHRYEACEEASEETEVAGRRMKRKVALGFAALGAIAAIVGFTALASEGADEAGKPIYLAEIPQGYRDFSLIAVARLTRNDGTSQLRAQLGNDLAIKAYREEKLPFPDGAIIAALHWNEVSSEENNQAFAKGFPGAGIQSFVSSSGVNMQFMVKDSKKYAATGGWGFGDFTNGKPGNEALMKTCFACHMPVKNHDFVFTRYAP